MKLLLKREPPKPDCTLGLLFVVGTEFSAVTIERPWIPSELSKGGTKGVSCIPVGVYQLLKHDTEAHPRTWALFNPALDVVQFPAQSANVNARSAVLIHPANYAEELRGCIAPGGYTASRPNGGYMVCESRKAFGRLQSILPWTDEHFIEVAE